MAFGSVFISIILHPLIDNPMMKTLYPLLILITIIGCSRPVETSVEPEATDEFVFGDLLPDSPELAARGDYSVGVQTTSVTNKDQADILNRANGSTPSYDRTLKLEIWYPAIIPDGSVELEWYSSVMGNHGDTLRPVSPFQFRGRCLRDAQPDRSKAAYPLIILSHGYTGTRLLFTYLAENLASKGYVVVSIHHTESTYEDAAAFSSTLLNRSLDQLFVLNEIARLSEENSGNFLAGLVDANNTGLVGYSMGGYGALNTMGAGYSQGAVQYFQGITEGGNELRSRTTASEDYAKSVDNRIKAVVAFAPWGMNHGVWDKDGLLGLKTPTLFVAGSKDDISGYENGIKAIFDGALNADRYLLTYVNARHNVAPNPPPSESYAPGLHIDEYLRYADSVWDMRKINNINQHFVTAFFGIYLQKKEFEQYLDLSVEADNSWFGFKPRAAVGLELRHETPSSD